MSWLGWLPPVVTTVADLATVRDVTAGAQVLGAVAELFARRARRDDSEWWAHFACHARADPAHPSTSRLWLHGDEDRPLTVAAISWLHLDDAELAYLSACDTARTGPALVDEVIHLASAFQLAGYRQAVGTLWPLVDRPGVRMAGTSTAPSRRPVRGSSRAVRDASVALRDRWPATPTVWATHVHAGT